MTTNNDPSTTTTLGSPLATPAAEQLTLHRDDLQAVLEATRDLPGQSKHTILYGPPGTGKTYDAIHSAAPGQRVIVVTMHVEGSATEFTGHKEIQNGDTVYWEGLGMQAWREGALLIINEIDNASEDIRNYLYKLLDEPEKLAQENLPDGTVVRPAPGFRVIATTNGRPEDLPPAVRDRLGLGFVVVEPSREMYDRLDPDVAEVVREIYAQAATGATARERVPYVTYRQADAFCDLRRTGVMRDAQSIATVVLHGDTERATRFVSALESARVAIRPEAPSELLNRGL